MRSSLSQQIQGALGYIGTASSRLQSAQQHAVTGKRILRSSDDVPGTNSAMALRSGISSIDQYTNNITVSKPLLTAAMNATDDLVALTRQVRDIAVAAANPDYTGITSDAYIAQLDSILEQMVDVAKTKQGDQYVFSGTTSNVPPVREDPSADPVTGMPPYLYAGSSGQRLTRVLAWVTIPLNVPGDELFNFNSTNGSTDMFSMVKQLRNAIKSGDSTKISAEIKNVDQNLDNELAWEARLGSWSARMDAAKNTLADTKIRMQQMLSDTEDVDLPSAIVELQTQENVYQIALNITQRVLDMSLASQNR